jgi:hypothetical protein
VNKKVFFTLSCEIRFVFQKKQWYRNRSVELVSNVSHQGSVFILSHFSVFMYRDRKNVISRLEIKYSDTGSKRITATWVTLLLLIIIYNGKGSSWCRRDGIIFSEFLKYLCMLRLSRFKIIVSLRTSKKALTTKPVFTSTRVLWFISSYLLHLCQKCPVC